MILERVLEEMAEASGPIRSTDLARRLAVSESALDGMIDVLVAKGRLLLPEESDLDTIACSGKACGRACVGLDKCPFIAEVPTTYTLVLAPSAAPSSVDP